MSDSQGFLLLPGHKLVKDFIDFSYTNRRQYLQDLGKNKNGQIVAIRGKLAAKGMGQAVKMSLKALWQGEKWLHLREKIVMGWCDGKWAASHYTATCATTWVIYQSQDLTWSLPWVHRMFYNWMCACNWRCDNMKTPYYFSVYLIKPSNPTVKWRTWNSKHLFNWQQCSQFHRNFWSRMVLCRWKLNFCGSYWIFCYARSEEITIMQKEMGKGNLWSLSKVEN